MLPCAQCHTLNRVELDFSYEVAKPEPTQEKKQEEEKEGKSADTKSDTKDRNEPAGRSVPGRKPDKAASGAR